MKPFLKQEGFCEAHMRRTRYKHQNPIFMHFKDCPLQSTCLAPYRQHGLVIQVLAALTINAYGVNPPWPALAVLDLVGTVFFLETHAVATAIGGVLKMQTSYYDKVSLIPYFARVFPWPVSLKICAFVLLSSLLTFQLNRAGSRLRSFPSPN